MSCNWCTNLWTFVESGYMHWQQDTSSVRPHLTKCLTRQTPPSWRRAGNAIPRHDSKKVKPLHSQAMSLDFAEKFVQNSSAFRLWRHLSWIWSKIWQAFTLKSAFCFMAKEKSFAGEVTNQLSPLKGILLCWAIHKLGDLCDFERPMVYHNFSSDKRRNGILVTIISSSNLGSQCSSNLPHPKRAENDLHPPGGLRANYNAMLWCSLERTCHWDLLDQDQDKSNSWCAAIWKQGNC